MKNVNIHIYIYINIVLKLNKDYVLFFFIV